MAGLGTPQSPYSGGGGLFNILSGLLGGIHQQNVSQESLKENKADEALKQAEGAQNIQMNQLTMKKTNMELDAAQKQAQQGVKTQAGTDLQQLTQQMITDPSRAKDPAFIAKYNSLTTA